MRLAEDYVLAKTRVASLEDVRSLNLWGNGITDVSVRRAAPKPVSVLARSVPDAASGAQLVSRMRNLEVLSLSVNRCASRSAEPARPARSCEGSSCECVVLTRVRTAA